MTDTPTPPAPSPREAVARIVYDRALPRNGTPFDCAVPSWVRDDAYKTADAAITAHTAALLAAASEPMPEEAPVRYTTGYDEGFPTSHPVVELHHYKPLRAYAVAQVAANAALRERVAVLEADAKRWRTVRPWFSVSECGECGERVGLFCETKQDENALALLSRDLEEFTDEQTGERTHPFPTVEEWVDSLATGGSDA